MAAFWSITPGGRWGWALVLVPNLVGLFWSTLAAKQDDVSWTSHLRSGFYPPIEVSWTKAEAKESKRRGRRNDVQGKSGPAGIETWSQLTWWRQKELPRNDEVGIECIRHHSHASLLRLFDSSLKRRFIPFSLEIHLLSNARGFPAMVSNRGSHQAAQHWRRSAVLALAAGDLLQLGGKSRRKVPFSTNSGQHLLPLAIKI